MSDLDAFVQEDWGTNDLRRCGVGILASSHATHLDVQAEAARRGYGSCETCQVLAFLADCERQLADERLLSAHASSLAAQLSVDKHAAEAKVAELERQLAEAREKLPSPHDA